MIYMKKRTIRHWLGIVVPGLCAFLASVSCGEDGVDGPVDMECTDIVTFEGMEGRAGVFTFRKVDDSPVIRLTAEGFDPKGVSAGSRMMLRYIPASGKPYTSGGITVTGQAYITQSQTAMEWVPEYDVWADSPVYVYSIWRSGSYLNMHVRLPYVAAPRLFGLVADPSTIADAKPDVYLVHILPDDAALTFTREYYASFDLSPVWDIETVSGITLHVANSNLDKHIFTFDKAQ